MDRNHHSLARWVLILLSAFAAISAAEARPKKGKGAQAPEIVAEIEAAAEVEAEPEAGSSPPAPEIPEALLELYPQAVFFELPAAILAGFTLEDFVAVAEACPAAEGVAPAHVAGCILASPKGQAISDAALGQLVEVFGFELAQQFPGRLALELSQAHLVELREACPAEGADEALSCLQKHPAFKLMALNDQFGREIFELLPPEVLVELPGIFTNYMTLEDFRLLNKLCPHKELEALGECLGSDEVDATLTPLLTRRILGALLKDMDAELPLRLDDARFATLADLCEKQGEAWSNCTIEHGATNAKCEEPEDALSACLLDTDIVVGQFVKIQKDKKDAIGRDVYVELAGLLAGLTVADIKALRAACPQPELAGLVECATTFAPVVEAVEGFSQMSSMMAKEIARQLGEVGVEGVKAEAYEARLFHLFLTLPMPSIMSLNRDCEAKHPELAKITSPSVVDDMLACIQEESRKDPIANPLYVPKEKLQEWMEIGRDKVLEILKEKEAAAQAKSNGYITMFLQIIALLGALGILLMPLFLRKKHPGKGGLLWKASLVASFTFALTILLLGASLLMMRTVQNSVASDATSPKIRIADGLFDVLKSDREIAQFAKISEEGLDFIKTPLMEIAEGEADPKEYAVMIAYLGTHWSEVIQEPEVKHLVKNAAMLKSHVSSVKTLLGFYKKISWIMGYLPIFLSFLAVILYLLPMKQTLLDIAQSPVKALERGEEVSGGGVFKGSMRTVWAEFKLIWPFMLMVITVLTLVGLGITLAVVPFIESLIDHILLSVFYIAFSEASAFTLYIAIGVTIVILVMILAIYIMSISAMLGTFRKILRECFHGGQRFGAFAPFWKKAPLALVWVLALPIIFSVGFEMFSVSMLDGLSFTGVKTGDIIIVPLVTFVVFPLFFFLTQGLKALNFIKKYPLEPAA